MIRDPDGKMMTFAPCAPAQRAQANFPPRIEIADDCKVGQFSMSAYGDGKTYKVVSNHYAGDVPVPHNSKTD